MPEDAHSRNGNTGPDRVQERLEAMRFAIDHAAQPIYWVRSDGGISYANEAACRSLGYSLEELRAMTVQDIDPDYPADLWPAHWASMKKLGSMTFDGHHRARDGRVFPVQITTNFVDRGGEERIWAYVHDVTDRRRAEEERRRLEAQLRQSQKLEAVGQLAGGVAHEFNNLLTIILGLTEMLLAEAGGEAAGFEAETRRSHLEQIASAGERAASLTRQLLAFSRSSADDPCVIPTSRVVSDTDRMLRHLIREDVDFEVVVEPDLAPIRAVSGHLEQVIINLVVNACDAVAGGGHVKLECANVDLDAAHATAHAGARTGRHFMVAVSDDGAGIPADVLERVFEPFYTTKPAGKGTGLGLATVHAFVTRTGGHVTVASVVGEGTTFRAYFPAAKPGGSTEAAAVAGGSGRGEVVLVCEDEAAVRSVSAGVLRSAGYVVLEADSGADALAVAARHEGKIDALVTDVVMPGMSGPALAEAMLGRSPGLRVLFVSGYPGDLVDLGEVRRAGHDFLGKPFGPAALLGRVRRVLDGLLRPTV